MDMYGVSSTTTNTNPDAFQIDDLLDFSNEELFSSTTTTPDSDFFSHQPPPHTTTNHLSSITTATNINPNGYDFSFTSELCVPNEEVAELEWLSQFVDDSFSDYPVNNLTVNNTIFRPEVSVPGKARSKRSRAPGATYLSWASALHSPSTSLSGKSMSNNVLDNQNQSPTSSSSSGGGRKCTHCASEKTPQWRTGPMGPKTLCNACGVRYKSGRLVPEYRPAASPTFTLTQHSNSHRKVMELRRQKERKESNRHDYFQHHDFEVC